MSSVTESREVRLSQLIRKKGSRGGPTGLTYLSPLVIDKEQGRQLETSVADSTAFPENG